VIRRDGLLELMGRGIARNMNQKSRRTTKYARAYRGLELFHSGFIVGLLGTATRLDRVEGLGQWV
jgi:hypothetical protein